MSAFIIFVMVICALALPPTTSTAVLPAPTSHQVKIPGTGITTITRIPVIYVPPNHEPITIQIVINQNISTAALKTALMSMHPK
jgi:hypothetical protein